MALITCPECGVKVSDKAAACPHCGYPIGEQPPRQTEGKAKQADNAERQFCIDRIHAGKVYIRCKCGCTIEKPFSFISRNSQENYTLNETLTCPQCHSEALPRTVLTRTPNAAQPQTQSPGKTPADSLLAQCVNCGKMTNKYKLNCECCGKPWNRVSEATGEFDILTVFPGMVDLCCNSCGGHFSRDRKFFNDTISTTAVVKNPLSCPSCGRTLFPGTAVRVKTMPSVPTDNLPKNLTKAKKPKKKIAISVAAIVICAVGVYLCTKPINTPNHTTGKKSESAYTHSSGSSSSSSHSSSSSSKYDEDDIKAGVYVLAKKCVKNHLKAPSTAEFTEMWNCGFSKGDDNIYMMTGYVDSENSFGAMLREQWSIMAEVNGDNVSLVMVTIGDQMYFD